MSQGEGEAATASTQPLKDSIESGIERHPTSSSLVSLLARVEADLQSFLEQLVLPPYPSPGYFSLLLPEEISAAVQTYLYAVNLFLRLNRDDFTTASDITTQPGAQIIEFLTAYANQRATNILLLSSPSLGDKIFNLIFRFISEGR